MHVKTGNVAQVIEPLLSKALSSNPSTAKTNNKQNACKTLSFAQHIHGSHTVLWIDLGF
jgi:hypothetical protein